jgi:YidC/Oxa1 family membrane protein insertase
VGPTRPLTPGAVTSQTTRLFAGAKTVPMLKDYEKTLGIPRFDDAVDWGMFWFFTKPIFMLLDFFFQHVGNFGVAILLLTVTVKIIFFPLANKSYESMSKMKKLSAPMEELRKKHKDDPAKQQQEIMALYAREKVNPFMGCLPVVIQIPVFYSLYKVLTVTIEMRHAPFFGWIHDLSSRDPISIWNLFGLLPYDPAAIPMLGGFLNGPLHLGPLVLAYGFTMWLTTAMNPPAPDPTQQKIFQLMPIMFTFIMAPFAVGLIIYWTWNNVLSILQQYVIMHRLKVENPIDGLIAKLRSK